MELGIKIKELRLKKGLTQEELASRCELTKGYISQLENDLNSPSIATLNDILTSLGTTLTEFFSDKRDEQVVFAEQDHFEKEDEYGKIVWLVPTAQKNKMEPIRLELNPGHETEHDIPHEGEEFGYVVEGGINLYIGKKVFTVKKGESFYFRADRTHYLKNTSKSKAEVIWLSCPPNF